MRDSYQQLFSTNLISKEKLFDFGLRETIFVDKEIAKIEWESLKYKVERNQKVFIRGFGRDALGTNLFSEFYNILLGNEHITKDPTNNAEPAKLIRKWTGYSKNGGKSYQPIRNYQISHVFGRTKNVYCFSAPWNIVYVPKIIDPFTGHEAKGDYVDEYTFLFQQETMKRFRELIDDYNSIVDGDAFKSKIESSIDQMANRGLFSKEQIKKLTDAVQFEFSVIV